MPRRLMSLWLLCQSAFGWWDEGHQLVAAVAKSQLRKDEVDSIESMLGYWAADYPETSSLTDAAIWPDHLKCRTSGTPGCKHISFLDGIETFSQWHYISLLYNPQGMKLPSLYAHFPLPETGAVWALTTLIGYDKNGTSDFPLDFCPTKSLTHLSLALCSDTAVSESDKEAQCSFWPNKRAQVDEVSLSAMWHRLTAFSWNFRLRMLIHILGDLHQPLHAIEAVTKAFPDGDRGGTRVRVTPAPRSKPLPLHVDNLHALWDTAGGFFIGEWPLTTASEIERMVPTLLKAFPRNSTSFEIRNFNYKHRLPVDVVSFQEIADESHTMAVRYIYGNPELQFLQRDVKEAHTSLEVDDDYRAKVQYLATGRIVLAGYRLAHHLKRLAALIQEAKKPTKTFPEPTVQRLFPLGDPKSHKANYGSILVE